MRKLITYLTILSFAFSQTIVKADSIKNKFDIQATSCSSNLPFDEYIYCLQEAKLIEITFEKKLKEKDKLHLFKVFSIGQIYYQAVYDKIIEEKKAYELWNKLLDSDYRGKIDKKKFKDMINNSQCLSMHIYSDFIDCYFEEFRSFEVYKKSSPTVKERLEQIMIHALALKDSKNLVLIASEYSVGQMALGNIDEVFEGNKDGFNYLHFMIDGLGKNFYSNKKLVKRVYSLNDKEIKTILIYLVATIAISYIAKKMLAKTFSSSVSSGSTASSGTQTFTTYQQNPISYTNKILPNVFRSAPANSILHNPWFRYNLFF